MLSKSGCCSLIAVSLLFFISSCTHEPEDINPGGIDSSNQCDPSITYFQNSVLPVLQSNCALSGCHDLQTAESDVILSSYEEIIKSGELVPGRASDSDLYELIIESDPDDRMPPPPNTPLAQEQIVTIRDWINQGAKNNYCKEDCDSTKFTFAETIQPLINSHCKGCHNTKVMNGSVNLDNYHSVAAIANNGKLYGTISHSVGFIPMPFNSSKLSKCLIAQVRLWVESGSPNN
jgi:hypothetical protein